MEGAPRPELVVVDVEKGMVQIPLQEINRSAPGGILIRATNGKRDKDGSVDEGWWEPGRGYLPASDPTVNSVCSENGRYCTTISMIASHCSANHCSPGIRSRIWPRALVRKFSAFAKNSGES